jgi:flagellar hook-length control protein FliK
MALILPSSSAPRPSSNASPNASARSDAPAEDGASSFGAALSRSLAPADKAADKTSDKVSSKTAPEKRLADKARTGVEDLINAMALGLVPLECRVVKAVPNGGAAATVATAVSTATAGAAASASTLAASAAVAAALNGDTARQDAMAPALAAAVAPAAGTTSTTGTAGAKDAGLNALTTVAENATLALTPGASASQNAAPDSGLGGQSEKRDSQDAIELTGMRAVKEAAFDLSAVQARSAAKISADLSAPASDSAAIRVVSSPAPDVATTGADVALPGANLLAPLPGTVALASTAAPDSASTASLAPDVGSSEWGKALGQQVVHMGKAGQPLAELQLNPPGLGPLKVTLSMNDQQMQASFVSAHASVRTAIEAALPQLRSTLADSGISLGNTSVSPESQQQQAFTDRSSEQGSQRSLRTSAPDAPALAAHLAAPPPRRSASSVDIYA